MIDRRLRQLAEDFASVPADEFEDLAQVCRDISTNQVDTRYFVLGECFKLTRGFFTEGDVGFVGPRFWQSLTRIWGDYLSAILDADSAEVGTVLASSLLDSLTTLGGTDPMAD
jgi:hypothetical protein